MDRQTGTEKKLPTAPMIRCIGAALLFLAGPFLGTLLPPLGGLIVLAGLYTVIRAKRIAARFGGEESAGETDAPSVNSKFLRQWWEWDSSVHESNGQPSRMQRALTQDITVMDIARNGAARVRGTTGTLYQTTFRTCTCPDFLKRGKPCKHMYLLALRYAGFNPVPYIVRNRVQPHPLRGYMNMGLFKVSGKNFETNRMNTKRVYALDQAHAIQSVTLEYGLSEPLSAEEIAYPDASPEVKTELSVEGVYVPEGAKLDDYSASSWRNRNGDEVTVTQELWEYAASCGIRLSALAGETTSREIFHNNHKQWKKI